MTDTETDIDDIRREMAEEKRSKWRDRFDRELNEMYPEGEQEGEE
jgi:hypothetical protein